MRFWIAACILTWALGLAGAARAADVPMSTDLQAESARAAALNVPLIVVFTSPTCHYCEIVKRDYLLPMMKNPDTAGAVVIRQIVTDSSARLKDFHGRITTQAAFAGAQGVTLTPTVAFFDDRGREVAKPIVGLLNPDYYYGYLEDAVAQAKKQIAARPSSVGPVAGRHVAAIPAP